MWFNTQRSGVRVKQFYQGLFLFWEVDSFLVFSPVESARCAIQAIAPMPMVPERVQAVVGSCVVIPCTFTPSDALLRLRRPRVDVQMIFRTMTPFFSIRSVAFNSVNKGQVIEQFQNRVSLFGSILGGDCSLRVEQIRQDDAKGFEISLKMWQDENWGRARKFTLEVLGESGGFGLLTSQSCFRGSLTAVHSQ